MMNRGYLSNNPSMHSGYPPSIYHPQQNQQNVNLQQQQQSQQHQQQQQGQPQSMLNGQHGQPQPNGGTSTDAQSQAASGGQGGQEMNLASVLHYLQSEWRRWERDRNEWEIERAEMRARIALLEGQRRSAENLKVDLLRRVKMLEFALRQERTKAVSTAGKASAIAPSRIAALQDEDKASVKDEKEGSGSEGSEEGANDRLKSNINGPISRAANVTGRAAPDTSAWKSIGSVPPRDPKSRARSREYLKQCLQEITYLTSPGALNPLPPRPPVTIDQEPPQGSNPDLQGASVLGDRPRKVIPDQLPPSQFSVKTEVKEEPESLSSANAPKLEQSSTEPEPSVKSEYIEPSERERPKPHSHLRAIENSARPPSSPAVRTMSLPDTEPNGDAPTSNEEGTGGSQLLTAIYRPESKAAWREELRAANEKAEKIRAAKSKPSEASDEEQLANISLSGEEEEVKAEPLDTAGQMWTTRRILRSHLDIVRSVAFAHGPGVVLASGGDDNTVKVWSIAPSSIMQRRADPAEIEPIATYRGHTAAVTTVVISSPLETIFSASMDTTIRLWTLPPRSADPYASYDPSSAIQILEGHTDIVWDLVLLPPSDLTKKNAREDRLVSASADGTVKLWTLADGKWSLKASWSFDNVVPTCLAVYDDDHSKVLIGLANGTIKLWDVEAGEELHSYGSEVEDGQPNAIICHPTEPAILSAHEDGSLHIFHKDGKQPSTKDSASASGTGTKKPIDTILAHPGSINSLALSPSNPMACLTGSVDCTVRLWDLVSQTSLQELGGHRKRSDEGVLAVASHPELPIVASAGADGVVRIWSSA